MIAGISYEKTVQEKDFGTLGNGVHGARDRPADRIIVVTAFQQGFSSS